MVSQVPIILTAIFTNLTRDHLDYHKSYKNYLNSKLILFKRLIKKRGVIIFDSKSPQAKILSKLALSKKFKILKLNDYNGIKIIKHTSIKEFQHINFMFKGKNFYFKTKLVGKVQKSNLLMSVLAASKFLLTKALSAVDFIFTLPHRPWSAFSRQKNYLIKRPLLLTFL